MLGQRIEQLRKQMSSSDLDAFVINSKANRYYISGFTGTYGQALIDLKNQYIIADGRYFEQLKTQSPDFTVIDNHMRMTETIQDHIRKMGYHRVGIESDEMNVSEYLGLLTDQVELVPTKNWIESQRMIKDTDELTKIKKAAQISDLTFQHILDFIKPGMTEQQVANEIDQYGLAHGADKPAFETIVASGHRSALPHGHASDKIIEENELIILDFGFEADHYFSDITRTIALGNISDELRHIYDVTLNAQKKAIAGCQAGVAMYDIDGIARQYISEAGLGDKFLHGTGHGLGLTVHEYPLLNNDSHESLQSHMTFTVEPGIYLEQKGGVRIEDDIWIDDQGAPVILTHAPKELIEL